MRFVTVTGIGIATSLHLQQKLHLKVQQKSHQKSHV